MKKKPAPKVLYIVEDLYESKGPRVAKLHVVEVTEVGLVVQYRGWTNSYRRRVTYFGYEVGKTPKEAVKKALLRNTSQMDNCASYARRADHEAQTYWNAFKKALTVQDKLKNLKVK